MSEIWDAIIRLKDLLKERQVLEELKLLLRLIVSIISKLTTKEELKERIRQSSELIVNYLYEDTTKSPAENVSVADSNTPGNGRIVAPWK